MDIVKRLRAAAELDPWHHEVNEAADEIECLRRTNKLLYDLFHEAVALPQGACPRPATAGDGMFNPHHRALNKQ